MDILARQKHEILGRIHSLSDRLQKICNEVEEDLKRLKRERERELNNL